MRTEPNIYDYVIIVYLEATDYTVVNTQDAPWKIIWHGENLEMAKVVKKAYCDGYFDAKIKENNMRTEEQILKDFEELGYDRIENTDEYLKLYKHDFIIELSKFYRCYKSYWEHSTLKIRLTINIDMQEHKLLHELLEIWGWI